MSEMSDYLENQLILHIFRTGNMTAISVLAHALLTTAPVDADDGAFLTGTGVEVADSNGYLRVDRPPLDANWDATSGSDGKTANTAEIAFPAASGGNWGNVKAIAICTGPLHNDVEMLLYTVLTLAQDINDGATARFAAGTLTCTFA